MKRAGEHVASTTDENPFQLEVPATAVSYDGTWHKHGHGSHFGVGVAVDVQSGLVLDTQVLSNYCHRCEVGPKPTSPNYIQWRASHGCQKNFDGSSNVMEAEAAVATFRRSVANRGLVYSKMLCDGDAKSNQKVNEADLYGFPITKEDCINHMSKRVFNALETIKNSNKKELNRKLTKPVIEKRTNTYATNLKHNAPDVIQMPNDVHGGILHMMSTDDDTQHHLCPPGLKSWCFFQPALALGEEPRKHRTSIRANVAFLLPIVDRLTQPDLLKQCAAMQTQNANECFNSLIWARCPKTEFASRRHCGPTSIYSVLQAMGVSVGHYQLSHSERKAQKKLADSDERVKLLSKWGCKERKRKQLKLEDRQETAEDHAYPVTWVCVLDALLPITRQKNSTSNFIFPH